MSRVALVTGAAGGIGYHIAIGFARKGYKVIGTDKIDGKFDEEKIEFIKMDLNSEEEISRVFEDVKNRYGGIHVLINNGAISNFNKSIFEISTEEFDEVISVNLRGAFICSKEFVKHNSGEEYGRIVNIASTRWNQNEENWEAYGASKGGLVSLTNTMAISLSNTNITVNAISPGWIQVNNYDELTVEEHKLHPSGRVGKPRDIVNTCLFLCHEENDFINGANLVVDGGMSKKMIYR
ncbi:MAG: SDR family NAD(P)-dependent oxidoreductase [Clostridium sp.]